MEKVNSYIYIYIYIFEYLLLHVCMLMLLILIHILLAVHFQKEEWVHLTNFFYRKRPGETVLVKILRDGKEHVFDVSLDFNVSHFLFF